MRQLRRLAFWAAVLVFGTGRMVSGDPPTAPELDPQEVFQAACERLKALEPKHESHKGVSKVKPQLQLNEKKRLASAVFVFEQNAVPPGKAPAKAKDEAKPFLYVSVQVWSGQSQQPPGTMVGQW